MYKEEPVAEQMPDLQSRIYDPEEYMYRLATEDLMRDSRARILTFGFIVFSIMLLQCSTFAQITEYTPIWSTYHSDTGRAGQNSNSQDITNPGELNLIWVSPRGDETQTTAPAEEDMIVDNGDAIAPPSWNFDNNPEAYGQNEDYLYLSIRNKEKAAKLTPPYTGAFIQWDFPGALPKGYYQIYIWVPPTPADTEMPQNTSQAEYTVSDEYGRVTIKFDQRDGGYWRLLTTRQFYFTGVVPGKNYIKLSNLTDDPSPDPVNPINNDIRVLADAVKFVPSTGMELYSSPASAEIPWSLLWTDNAGTDHLWEGQTQAVYVGSVENPLTMSNESPDTGAVYCINSVTTSTGVPTTQEELALADQLGRNIWRYPNSNPADRDELEGPIEGGVYSSPTLSYVQTNPLAANGVKLVCFVAANDRQLYAINAQTGDLLWKGPGMTVSETGGFIGTWVDINDRLDAFGGIFRTAETAAAGAGLDKTSTWLFPDASRRDAGEPPDGGWSYTVYAWIPAQLPGDDTRSKDASYTITYMKTGSAVDTEEVSVDQSNIENQGKWVSLGDFFNVQKVTLNNITKQINPGNTVVVADAVMIVPALVGSFEKCSPVVNTETPNGTPGSVATIPDRVYVVSSDGRMLNFDAAPIGNPAQRLGHVNWIYPKIRSAVDLLSSDSGDQPSWGEIGSSPAYCKIGGVGKLYITCGDGTVRCVDAEAPDDETLGWVFPDSVIDATETTGGFTSSPAIDKQFNQLFIGSTMGAFYCLHLEKQPAGTTQLKKKYPIDFGTSPAPGEPPTPTKMPLGAFRFSTAAISEDTQNDRRVWVGSTDGHVYSFGANPTDTNKFMQRLRVEFDDDGVQIGTPEKWFAEPATNSSIQGSIALDSNSKAGGAPMVMYVGDMSGTLHWYNADTGLPSSGSGAWAYQGWRTGSELFSSPNITKFMVGPQLSGRPVSYIYVGGSDGRIYAFSPNGGAWGGRWALGSWWPFPGTSNGEAMRELATSANTDIQFDIFSGQFCKNSEQFDPELTFTISGDPTAYHVPPNDYTTPAWPADADAIISKDMKLPSFTTPPAVDDDVDTRLTELAKLRRAHVEFAGTRQLGASNPNSALYFEWGEKLNVILWNLPALNHIQGTSISAKRNAIKFNIANTSPGSSAGSLIRDIKIRTLKEYTVLNLESPTPTVTDSSGSTPVTRNHYNPLTYPVGGGEVKRSYAIAEIAIPANGQRVLSPGPGWVLTVDIKRRTTTSGPYITETIPLARLKPGTTPPQPLIINMTPPTGTGVTMQKYSEQLLGINNPLAIRDDASSPKEIAWPLNYVPNRDDPEAHFNGNAAMVTGGTDVLYDQGKMPVLNMNQVAHGTSSRLAKLGVMDRSAVGTTIISAGLTPPKVDTLQRFRISSGDLRWLTNSVSVITSSGGVKLPWEQGIGSVDYPNLYKRYQDYRKFSDDANPAKQHTTLPAIALKKYAGDWVTSYSGIPGIANTKPDLRPETVAVSVAVPKYQPANIHLNRGYSRTMEAFIDSNSNGICDLADNIGGRPSTRQEVYRSFRVDLQVRPDPKIEVEEQTIDIGRAPHGLGEALQWPFEFTAFNPSPDVQKWFKKVTIKNAGNVNLTNVQIAKTVPLLGDKNSSFSGISGAQITSSLDGNPPDSPPLTGFAEEPFTTITTTGDNLGYTITKPKIGDPDPSVMTIPDRRKWDSNYNYTKDSAGWYLQHASDGTSGTGWPADKPLDVKVSVRVPISQPVGSYQSWLPANRSPFVPVYAGMAGNSFYSGYQPQAAPSFQLRLNVVENQVTGGVSSPAVLPMVDAGPLPKVGDDTPAAFRDKATGNVHLIWSSNRMPSGFTYPNWLDPNDAKLTEFANAPWFLDRTMLAWNGSTWVTATPPPSTTGPIQWWNIPAADQFIPNITGASSPQWPTLLSSTGSVPKWKYANTLTDYDSVKHHSPVFAENETSASSATKGLTWLAWAGSADVYDPATSKMTQEHRIFYTDATGGNVVNDPDKIHNIKHDPVTAKLHPNASVFRDLSASSPVDRMWMFWQGGESGRWSIFYSTNDGISIEDGVDFPSENWAANDLRLRTPDCLASVSSPNAIHRKLWTSLASVSPTYADARHLFDLVYAGTTKFSQTSDVLLSRYTTVTSGTDNASPSRRAQPLPRVFDEKLEKDAKYGFYASQHLAWIRLGRRGFEGLQPLSVAQKGDVLGDQVGRQPHMAFETVIDPLLTGGAPTLDPTNMDLFNLYNLPYIWVVLPANYDDRGWLAGAAISGTTGSITDGDGTEIEQGQPIIPEIDDSTGIYTYKYTGIAKEILGDMMVDYSTGVVRFTKPFTGVTQTDGSVKIPEVHADYTPQTWRLTTSSAVDNSPRAFIDRTPMKQTVYPGMGAWEDSSGTDYYAPIDRLWTFWRKAGTGVDSSTVFYKTYRVGVDITKLVDTDGDQALPIQWNNAATGPRVTSITVTGNFGPWEVDRSGRRIYFSEVDERYRSLLKSGSTSVLGTLPGPITVEYTNTNGEPQTVRINDAYWLEELSEQPLFTASSSVNEGSIYAFADPGDFINGTVRPPDSSKIWVFWTSTRAGTSDLFWETVSPTFTAW